MAQALREEEERYTYAEYCTWDDGERYELIGGEPYMLAAPSVRHQLILSRLAAQFQNFLTGKPCKVLFAPLYVFLFAQAGDNLDDMDTLVQPDLMVVCDSDKLKDERGVMGAPDLALEILSPSSLRMDRITKFFYYQRAGVKEYWIVDPKHKTVSVHTLYEGRYGAGEAYPSLDKVPVGILEGCEIDLSMVFQE